MQATAALAGVNPDQVIEAWGLGEGEITEPSGIDPDEIREAYAAVRDT